MYYYLNGDLSYLDTNTAVIDCGGVGYKCTVSLNTAAALANRLGETVKLYTHLAVREDGIELFGFGSESERVCFNQLTSVSGVGPKAAMSIGTSVSRIATHKHIMNTFDLKNFIFEIYLF